MVGGAIASFATVLVAENAPSPFMQAMRAQSLEAGVPAVDIADEVFGPDLWLAGGLNHVFGGEARIVMN
ncbi:UNVERIFIED_CONTAM: hypothetical protein DES50_102360 [Williamsia faeni]